MQKILLCIGLFAAICDHASALSPQQLENIGRRVWQNESNGSRDGLTAWNSGENFGSFGIGHFIWYPKGESGPYEESFPALMKFLKADGANVADWMTGDCPWPTKAVFYAEFQSARMKELRELLASTVGKQSQFLAKRMENALPKLLGATKQRELVEKRFRELLATEKGTFALIDYVNFKGEGTNPKERYDGQGWGLLQVIEGMEDNGGSPAQRFGESADRVLTARVKRAPKNESQWLPGWRNRVRSYGK